MNLSEIQRLSDAELDRACAALVMGWTLEPSKVFWIGDDGTAKAYNRCPHPSNNWNPAASFDDAMTCVRAVLERDFVNKNWGGQLRILETIDNLSLGCEVGSHWFVLFKVSPRQLAEASLYAATQEGK